MESKKTIIENYMVAHPHPDPEFCPFYVGQYNTKKKGVTTTNYYEMLTGKLFKNDYPGEEMDNKVPNRIMFVEPTGHKWPAAWNIYIEYDRTHEMLIWSQIQIKGDKPDAALNRDKRNWLWVDSSTRFIFKEDPNVYNSSGDECFTESQGKFYNKEFAKVLNYWMKVMKCNKSMSEWRDFMNLPQPSEDPAGLDHYGSYNYDSYWKCAEHYKKNVVTRKETATGKKLEELTKLPLKDLSVYKNYPEYGIKYTTTYGAATYNLRDYWVYEKINSEYGVFRLLRRPAKYSYSVMKGFTNDIRKETEGYDFNQEDARIYINKITGEITGVDVTAMGTSIKSLANMWDSHVLCNNIKEAIDDQPVLKANLNVIEYGRKKIREGYREDGLKKLLPSIDMGNLSTIMYLIKNNACRILIRDENPLIDATKGVIDNGYVGDMIGIPITSKSENYESLYKMKKEQVENIGNRVKNKKWDKKAARLVRMLYDAKEIISWDAAKTDKILDEAYRICGGGYFMKTLVPHPSIYYWRIDKNTKLKDDEKEVARNHFELLAEAPGLYDTMNIISNKAQTYPEIEVLYNEAKTVEEIKDLYIKAVTVK